MIYKVVISLIYVSNIHLIAAELQSSNEISNVADGGINALLNALQNGNNNGNQPQTSASNDDITDKQIESFFAALEQESGNSDTSDKSVPQQMIALPTQTINPVSSLQTSYPSRNTVTQQPQSQNDQLILDQLQRLMSSNKISTTSAANLPSTTAASVYSATQQQIPLSLSNYDIYGHNDLSRINTKEELLHLLQQHAVDIQNLKNLKYTQSNGINNDGMYCIMCKLRHKNS